MTAFSASDAAFSGFHFIRRQPTTVLIWAGAYLVYQLANETLLVSLAGDKLAVLQSLSETNRTDPAAALAMLPSLALVFVVALPVALAFLSVMNSAVYRALMRPEDVSPGYFRLGQDEVRMAGLILIWVLLAIGYGFLVLFVSAMGAAIGFASPAPVRPIFFTLWGAAALAALIYPTVRLSLSMPLTVASRHIHVFDSWILTRGRFWSLLGAYALCWILILVVQLVSTVLISVIATIAILTTGGSMASLRGLFSADVSSLSAFFTPARMIAAILAAPVSAAIFAVAASPSVQAYLAFSAPPAAPPSTPVIEPEAAPAV